MYCSPPGSSVHGIVKGRILELLCPPPEDLPDLGIKPASLESPELARGSLPLAPPVGKGRALKRLFGGEAFQF